jgi:hypothetical protein
MRRGRVLPALVALGVLALAGCEDPVGPDASSDAPTGVPASESPTASASPTSTPSPGTPNASPTASPTAGSQDLPRSQVRASLLHTAALGRNAASTPEEKAVVTAWMGYWQAATDTYFYGRPPQQLTRFAAGDALKAVRDTLARQKAMQHRAVGWARDNITDVQVTGGRATVQDCTENYTFDVDEEGAPATTPTPWYGANGTLEKRAGRWVVVQANSKKLYKSCLS